MHHRLQALADGAESSQSQQVQRCGAQRCHHAGAITAVKVIVFPQLGVADPVPALQAPALSHQTQQRIWGGAQAGDVDEVGRRPYRCVAMNGLPSRVPLAITSTIQLVPCQLALMYSGASFALKVQKMSRP